MTNPQTLADHMVTCPECSWTCALCPEGWRLQRLDEERVRKMPEAEKKDLAVEHFDRVREVKQAQRQREQ